jgi:hypothetical protein
VVKEDVRLQRAHKKEGGGARFFHVQDAGLGGAAEVVGDDAEAAARRGVVVADVEGKDDRRLRAAVHVDGEVLGDGAGDEGDELLGQAAKHDARILGAAGGLEADDAGRQLDVPRAHGGGKEGLLGGNVAEGVTPSSAAMSARVVASKPFSAKTRLAVSRRRSRVIVGGRPISK